jgi:hypothetical protein
MVPQPFAIGGNQSYPEFWVVTGDPRYPGYLTLIACVKVVDCCDPSSAGTLTCVKMLVMVLRAFCHRVQMIRNRGSFSFVLVGLLGPVALHQVT